MNTGQRGLRSNAVLGGLLTCLLLFVAVPGRGEEPGEGPTGLHPVTFDIPAQPLVSALDAYGAATGREIFYDGALASGLSSMPVIGDLGADTALSMLLRGTGLVPRKTGPNRVSVAWAHDSSGQDRTLRRYFASVQAAMRRAFCSEALTRPSEAEMIVRLWIASSGAVTRAALEATAHPARERAFARALQTAWIDEPPPAGLRMPLIMVIFPHAMTSADDCRGASSDVALGRPGDGR